MFTWVLHFLCCFVCVCAGTIVLCPMLCVCLYVCAHVDVFVVLVFPVLSGVTFSMPARPVRYRERAGHGVKGDTSVCLVSRTLVG